MVPIITKDQMDSLRNYRSVQIWLRGKKLRTKYNYLRFLTRLTLQIEDSPDGLLKLVRTNPRTLPDLIKDFSAEYSGSQAVNCRIAIRGFFASNGLSLP